MKNDEDNSSISKTDVSAVFLEGHIQGPMQAVIDCQVEALHSHEDLSGKGRAAVDIVTVLRGGGAIRHRFCGLDDGYSGGIPPLCCSIIPIYSWEQEAYGSFSFREYISNCKTDFCIPPKSNSIDPL